MPPIRNPQSAIRNLLVAVLLELFLSSSVCAERLPIKTYTTDDGLNRNTIRHIIQDSRGYLWLTTISGLSRFDGYSFKNYGIDQSVYLFEFNRMIEDRNGGYWIATAGGPYKFDPETASKDGASRFKPYPLSAGARSPNLYAIFQDRAGRVWAGGLGGLFCLDAAAGKNEFQQIEMPAEEREKKYLNVSNLLEDPEGNLWIATDIGLYRRLPDGRIVRYRLPTPERGEANQLLYDRNGRLWVEHSGFLTVFMPEPASTVQGDQVFRFPPKEKPIKNGNDTKIILPTSPGEALRISGKDGILEDNITGICQSFDGKIWFGLSDKGLLLFDGKGFRLYAKEEGLSYNKIRSLAEDGEGNLWIGTNGGGLMKKVRGGFTGFSETDGIDETLISFAVEDLPGEICIAANSNRVCRFDGKRFNPIQGQEFDRLLPSINNDLIRYFCANPILKDHTGEWWLSTGMGLYRYPAVSRIEMLATTKPKAVYMTKDGLPANAVYRIFEDSRRDIWISFAALPGGRLCKWERATERFRVFGHDEGLTTAEIVASICEDRHGNLWFGLGARGSKGGELARYSSGRFQIFSKPDGAPEGVIRNMLLDSSGRLWIASARGGLSRIDDTAAERPVFINYAVGNGLADNETNCIAEDRWGKIYVGMGRGLDRIDPDTGRIRHYSSADGLNGVDVRKIFRDSQMNFWIGTSKGLSHFIPEPEQPKPPPPILIEGLRIAGNDYPISDLGEKRIAELELEADQNNLQIDFISQNFGFNRVVGYEYKLEGAEQDWQSIGTRAINFANLQAGAYRFLVRAVNDDGLTSSAPAAVEFRILRPVWQRWWFLTIAALIAAIPALLIVRYRRRQIKAEREAEKALRRSREERLAELEQVRRRIATDLHDDIGSSLTRISLLSEVAQRKLDGADAAVKEPLSLIAGLSRELVDSMSEIVWAINPSKDHLSDLTRRMRHFASDVFTARQIDFRFRAPNIDQDVKVGANVRREVFLIFKEAVNNIARHSECAVAEMEFRIEDDMLILNVSDNGKGFDVSKESAGHGLASMGARARELGGSLEIVSEPGQGAALKFTIPQKREDGDIDKKNGAPRIFMRRRN